MAAELGAALGPAAADWAGGAALGPAAAPAAADWVAIDALGGVSCAELTSCASCSNASAFCHFCESDGECHALGSIYGCAVGMTCYSNSECVRGSADFTGYEPVSASTVMGAFVLGVALLVCCLGCCGMWRVFGGSKEEAEGEGEYVRMKTFRGAEAGNAGAGDDDDDNWDPLPPRPQERRWRRACGVCALVVLPVALTVLVLFAPAYPEYEACNTEFEWSEFFASLASLSLEGKYEVLVSVSNPNRLGVTVVGGHADFKLDGAVVATWDADRDWGVPAGSVADVLAVLDFTPSTSQALALYERYSEGDLVLDVDATVDLKIDLAGSPVFDYNYVVDGYSLDLAVAGERDLCNCPAW